MGVRERPFFDKVRVWEPEAEARKEFIYLELTNSGAILAFGTKIPTARWPGGADHGFPWLHLRARSVDGGRSWTLEERNWWEPEKRPMAASVVDESSGDIFRFNHGTWPLQDDMGQPMSESWMITNYDKGRQMGARLTMDKSVDDGRTWTAVDMTEQLYTYPGAGLAWFIGRGIQLQHGRHQGRLVIPGRYFTRQWEGGGP